MNMQIKASQALRVSTNAEQFIDDLTNGASPWHQLRIAEMSGNDFIFAPDAICGEITTAQALTRFLAKTQTLLGSPRNRATLISFWHDQYRNIHFVRYTLDSSNGAGSEMKKELLDNSPQQDFIYMLHQHSEPLISGHSETVALDGN